MISFLFSCAPPNILFNSIFLILTVAVLRLKAFNTLSLTINLVPFLVSAVAVYAHLRGFPFTYLYEDNALLLSRLLSASCFISYLALLVTRFIPQRLKNWQFAQKIFALICAASYIGFTLADCSFTIDFVGG